MKKNKIWLIPVLIILLFLGLADSSFLTYEHFSQSIPPCSLGSFSDCGQVLKSNYSVIFGVPVALFGVFYYSSFFIVLFFSLLRKKDSNSRYVFLISAVGLVISIYFTFLQFAVIKAICLYCLGSALISLLLYVLVRYYFFESYQKFLWLKLEVLYKYFFKKILFLIEAEVVHRQAMFWGEIFGNVKVIKYLINFVFHFKNKNLQQNVAGIYFENPIGLSAGYDYDGAFPNIMSSFGFGFETIGTITLHQCVGNEKPRLGRLPKSQSLLVNKGFRNPGVRKIISKLERTNFELPVGISIGTTNSEKITTELEATRDIVRSFNLLIQSDLRNSYYELNISCPNLKTKVSFYTVNNLKKLLSELSKLDIEYPVFIKMPIDRTDTEFKKLLDVIIKYPYVKGVIIGNLQKDRNDASFVKEEIEKAGVGNFSGKPTFKRSNELIGLTHKYFGKKLIIIGCGGVFTAEDAYLKIRLGASLVQLITGMIYEGPQRIAQINQGLSQFLKRDGYKNIGDAVGSLRSN